MRILITGVAGFIGSNLAQRFLEEKHEVIGIDNYITGSESNINHLIKYQGFNFVEWDVIKPIDFIEGELDWIMHFASPASPPKYMKKSIETLRVNGEGTFHLLELCIKKRRNFSMHQRVKYMEIHLSPHNQKSIGGMLIRLVREVVMMNPKGMRKQ